MGGTRRRKMVHDGDVLEGKRAKIKQCWQASYYNMVDVLYLSSFLFQNNEAFEPVQKKNQALQRK